MMAASRSQHLRIRDIRGVFSLLGDIRDLRHQPILQRERSVHGLCQLLGGWQGIAASFEGFTQYETVRASSVVSGGWPDAHSLRIFAEWAGRGRFREDPLVAATVRERGPVFAVRRPEIVDDKTHQHSGVYEAWYDVAGVGDTMVCFYRKRDASRTDGIAIHREMTEPPLTPRDRRMLSLFQHHLYRLYREGVLGSDEAPPALPPRQQQVLQQLLVGEKPGRIADRMGLSRRTIEDYIDCLYSRFAVADRAELMARFVTLAPLRQEDDHGA